MGRHWGAYWHSVTNRVTNGMFAIGKAHLGGCLNGVEPRPRGHAP